METTATSFLHLPLLFLLLLLPHASAIISDVELQNALAPLRSNGLDLFANAILSSDIRYRITSSSESESFTLLAPPNSELFAIDLASKGSDYVRTLRRHVLARRLSFADLCAFPVGSFLQTLLPGGDVAVGRWNDSGDVVTVDGMRIFPPDLYLTARISIHGLGGVLGGGSGGEGWNSSVEDGYLSPVGDFSRSHSLNSEPMLPEVIDPDPVLVLAPIPVLSPIPALVPVLPPFLAPVPYPSPILVPVSTSPPPPAPVPVSASPPPPGPVPVSASPPPPGPVPVSASPPPPPISASPPSPALAPISASSPPAQSPLPSPPPPVSAPLPPPALSPPPSPASATSFPSPGPALPVQPNKRNHGVPGRKHHRHERKISGTIREGRSKHSGWKTNL